MKNARKLSNSRGQNVTEFTIVLVLVMAGIVVMAPYVIRSWNANLKGWEDSNVDSFNEPLVEAPDDGIELPFCDCEPFADVECDAEVNTPLGLINCGPREMLQSRRCRPQDCEWSFEPPPVTGQCVLDDRCCTDPVATGNCGANASQPEISPGVCLPTFIFDADRGICTCPDGMMESSQLCGADPNPHYICVDDPLCQFDCTGVPTESVRNTGLCPNDDTGLLADTPAVASYACSSPDGSFPKCQYVCKFPFVPKPDQSDCECPDVPPAIENPPGSGNWEIIVCKHTPNFNIRNSMPANLRGSVNVTVTIDPGVGVYSPSLAPAMTTGDFPLGSTVRIINNGYIEGRGGNGGPGQFSEGCPGGGYYRVEPGYGRPGGDALVVTYPVTIDNSGGKIYAGGGGGGSGAHKCTYNGTGGGGGGAGWTPGRGGVGGREVNSGWPGRSGTHDVGGAGGRGQCGSNGGRGGNPGQPGRWGITDCASNGSSRPGQPGVAVRGSGLITWSPKGDVRGSEIPF